MKKCKYYKPYMDTLKFIIKRYYELESCACGGPLHILLDDDNYDLDSIHFCINHCFEDLWKRQIDDKPWHTKEANILGIMICNEYAKMSLAERAIFDSYLNGSDLRCCGDCNKCPHLDNEHHDFIKEKEKTND